MEKSNDQPDPFFAVDSSEPPHPPPLYPQQRHHHEPPSKDHRRRALSFAATTATTPLQQQQHQQHYPTRSRFPVAPAESLRVGVVQHSNSNNIVDDKPLSSHVLAGLSTAGVASTLLTTLFVHIVTTTATSTQSRPARRFWSVETDSLDNEQGDASPDDTFSSYDSGGRVALLTLASFGGAWWFDQQTNHSVTQNYYYRRRSDWIGVAGLVLTVTWMLSLWRHPWLYEACLGVFTIVLASSATDDHRMTYNARSWFQFSSEIMNLMATLVVTFVWIFFLKSATSHGDESDRDGHDTVRRLRDKWMVLFSILIVLVALSLFVAAQNMIHGTPVLSVQSLIPRRRKVPSSSSGSDDWRADAKQQRRLQWRPVMQTIFQSRNFRAWIGMEMLLEAQVLFQTAFWPIFMEWLMNLDENSTQWLEPATKPLRQLAGILVYLPIQRYGYVRIYTVLFYANLIVSLMLLILGDYTKLTGPVLFALPIVSGGVLNSGFQFAMADMTLEIKHSQASRGGKLEPSLAALLLGFNAVFCKPMKYIFVATGKAILHESNNSRLVAFYLMVTVPMICSVLQLYFWSGYGLTRQRVTTMRADFQRAAILGVERHDSGQVSV